MEKQNNEEVNNIVEDPEIKKEEKSEEVKYSSKELKNKKRFSLFEVFILMIVSITVSMILGMFLVRHNNKTIYKKEKLDPYLERFIQNYNYIVDNYYEDIDKDKLINSSIEGMMNSLDDPYSAYIEGDTAKNFNINLEGSYQGLGISIVKDPETGYIVTYAVFKNSPADKAGLKSGDIIKSINGEGTETKETSEFSNYILNSKEQEFNLVILRGEEESNITIKKENVTIDSVTSKVIETENKKIGYIYMSIFANNTASQFLNALNELEQQGIDSLIIDVRSNTGGHLTAVDEILKNLLTKKQVIYQLSQNDESTKYYGILDKNKEYEIVLLGDNYTASASEVLISGLRDNLSAKLIGVKTFGKGTVQELVTLTNGVQYKITTKKWLTPNGNWINETEGIEPDIEVKMNEKYYNTYDDSDDNQLQTAIDYLKNK